MKIVFHCRNCRKGLRMSYETGDSPDVVVLRGITVKCKTCTRVISPKNFTQRHIMQGMSDGKFFI